MKAVRFHEFGGPEVLKYEDVPEPTIRKDQVLIKVKACALNHLDLWVRKGLPGIKLPHINGSDISGDVIEAGEYVSDLKPGERVLLAPMVFCGHCQACLSGQQNFCRQFTVLGAGVDGGNCELIAVERRYVVRVPSELTYDEAASVPLVFLTAWHMLVTRAQIKPGQIILVLGAGSGIGTAAIQIGKLFHCKVITTAGDESKMEQGRDLGADYTINHYKDKISDEVKKITAKAGVDVVFEHVGKATWEESLKSLRPGGTLVTCGATTGPDAAMDLRFLYSKQFNILGSYMGTMGELLEVLKYVFNGTLKPVVDKTYPLREARAAHERIEKREQFGKVVLNP
jgi:NADPH:quinone reductase-like Zn-dependent oxidoreductase